MSVSRYWFKEETLVSVLCILVKAKKLSFGRKTNLKIEEFRFR